MLRPPFQPQRCQSLPQRGRSKTQLQLPTALLHHGPCPAGHIQACPWPALREVHGAGLGAAPMTPAPGGVLEWAPDARLCPDQPHGDHQWSWPQGSDWPYSALVFGPLSALVLWLCVLQRNKFIFVHHIY